jgi:glycosyltransferase involved in cell wall biosynthesis
LPRQPLRLSCVVPAYNEQANIEGFLRALAQTVRALTPDFEIVVVNDGSRDGTHELSLRLAQELPLRYLALSRNFGKEAALTAGLDRASGDAVIPIDSDLQHPPEMIHEMLAHWEAGAEVVLAQRRNRETDGPVQKLMATLFYRFHNVISNVHVPPGVGDFRLMDKRVVAALRQLPENHRFMKGLFAWVGFRTVTILYSPAERAQGTSSFNLWKLWNFALEGITSFSTAPLRIWSYLGAVVSATALVYAALIVLKTLLYGTDVPGYASLMAGILFLGGVQLIGIGVLGEYIGRIYHEVKRRPVYLVREEHLVDQA